MKTLLKIILFFLVFSISNNIMSQTSPIYKGPETENEVTYVIDEETNQGTYQVSGYDYGYWYEIMPGEEGYKKWYSARKAYQFDLTDIPSNALSVKAYFEAFYTNYSSGTAKIVLLSDNINFSYDLPPILGTLS